jgi:threonine aldolase
VIDLRSDTVTRPTPAMRAAMADAEVGDDVFGDDPTVDRLQAAVAERVGKQAGLFVPSGTQSNLIALMTHCGRGDEYLVGADAHTYRYEAGGAAVLGSIQPQPVGVRSDGMVELSEAEAAIKPDDPHFATTRLLCLENTNNGRAYGVEPIRAARELADRRGLALHLDGARLFNAAVALGVDAAELAAPVDTVSICLSKGLGAPIGSVLCGPAELIARARRHRKILGGGMRQAGVVAAAGLVALAEHVDRLAQDHANAAALAKGLAGLDWLDVEPARTNMVFATIIAGDPEGLVGHLERHGVRTLAGPRLRLVTHLDVTADDVAAACEAFASYRA